MTKDLAMSHLQTFFSPMMVVFWYGKKNIWG